VSLNPNAYAHDDDMYSLPYYAAHVTTASDIYITCHARTEHSVDDLSLYRTMRGVVESKRLLRMICVVYYVPHVTARLE
jgi:hypothetical protein